MNGPARCSQCEAELPADAPQGLCAACLLKRGLATQSAAPSGSEPPAEDFVPPTPAELAAHFPDLEIIQLLGRGGMGMVYKARQKGLDRLVALKILLPTIARDAAFAERFAREARAMARLSHPSIVAVYDFGESDGLYYFLMEYVDGLTLGQLLQAGQLAPADALAVVPQICEALQYAHDNGVVHRDIKPANILIDRRGRVKIADFGLAKLVGRPVQDVSLTGTGQVMGTPHYMAPEQIEHPQQVDHRADIYSLGVVFYQMLTGELPLGRFAPPSKKVTIDVRLDEVVLRALEREPELRYQQASEVKSEVETILTSPPMATGPAAAPAEVGTIEQARSQVRGPAIGLLATGILNWAIVPFIIVILMYVSAAETSQPLPGFVYVTVFGVLLGVLILSSLMVVAAMKMKRLESYRLAIAGSILAMIVSPGSVLGLPMGIWSLLVLSRRDVRAAYRKAGVGPRKAGRSWKRDAVRSIVVAVAVALVVRTFIVSVYWVVGDPVGPEIPQGSYVLVFKLAHAFGPGDIIVYHEDDVAKLARVTEAGPSAEGLRIERTNRPSRLIPANAVIGKVILNTRSSPSRSKTSDGAESEPKTTGSPRIDRVVVAGGRALIEGRGSKRARLIFKVGKEASLGCVLSDSAFTAVLRHEAWGGGLTCLVTDATGKELLKTTGTKVGPMIELPGRVVFHEGTPELASDRALQIAEFRPETGRPVPITVQLEAVDPAPKPTGNLPQEKSRASGGMTAPAPASAAKSDDRATAETTGFRFRLQAEKRDWAVGEMPRFTASEQGGVSHALEFHIVPNPAGTDRKPSYPQFVGKTEQAFAAAAVKELAEKGPSAAQLPGGEFGWFELASQVVVPNAVAGEYRGRKYILLCALEPYVLRSKTTGKDAWGLKEVSAGRSPHDFPIIDIRLDRRGGELFAALTNANIQNRLAVVAAGRVVAAPTIMSQMSDRTAITGHFSDEEVENLVKALKRTGGQQDRVATDKLDQAIDISSDPFSRLDQRPGGAAQTSPTVDSVPPVVVSTQPVSGSSEVSPGLAEIRVTFSKQMTDLSWSWATASPSSTPEELAPPRYDSDLRTCTIKVSLEPGKTYAYWLNGGRFRGFRDHAGQAAVPYLLIFRTRASTDSP